MTNNLPSILAAAAISFHFQPFTAVSLKYSMSQLDAPQAAVLRKFKQWQSVEILVSGIVAIIRNLMRG